MENEKGFTLIELLIVVSIIGILAAIAIPQFGVYRGRAMTAEGYQLASDIMKDVVDFYRHTGRFPVDNKEAAISEPKNIRGKYVESISVNGGAINISFNEKAENSKWKVLTLRPALYKENMGGPVLWLEPGDKGDEMMAVFGEDQSLGWGKGSS